MIVVDTSVWIDYFNGVPSRPAEQLDYLLDREAIVVGDLVLMESCRDFTATVQRPRRSTTCARLRPSPWSAR
jgi:predicted nucleic acid-binding protein